MRRKIEFHDTIVVLTSEMFIKYNCSAMHSGFHVQRCFALNIAWLHSYYRIIMKRMMKNE